MVLYKLNNNPFISINKRIIMETVNRPTKEYDFNKDNIDSYINFVSGSDKEKDALRKFFDVSKYVSFKEFEAALKSIISKFTLKEYAACLFTIDFESVTFKSNLWIYKLLKEFGLPLPVMSIHNKEELKLAVDKGIKNFVFIDDASYSGYQIFDTVYTTFLSEMLKLKYIDVNIHLLVPYISKRALGIFNMILPGKEITVPLSELSHRFKEAKLKKMNNSLKGHVNINIIYHEEMKILKDQLDKETLTILNNMEIKDHKVPIYFSYKMPDYLSSYSEIYIGFTLQPPYSLIPLVNNSKEYYNKTILKKIRSKEDVEDYTRDAPCPPAPYK